MSERLKILNMIENGEITPKKGAQMLEDLSVKEETKTPEILDQMSILNKIENGEISSEEGIRLLEDAGNKVEKYQTPPENDTGGRESASNKPPNLSEGELNKWKHWWTYPLYIGVGLTILAAYWMNFAYQSAGYGFWFFCSWIPLLIGILLMALSWHSRTGTWLHVRVKSKHQRVAISLPAPLGIIAFTFRHFGQFFPQMENTSLDEIIVALKDTAESGNPFYVHVDEGEDGEQVEVFLG